MQHPKTRIALLAALILAALALAIGIAPQTTAAVAPTPRAMRVKLYEDGKPIGEWTTEGGARNEGNVLIFSTRQGVSSREVRIHGTYVAEAID
jgi:hypothetical protein